MKYIICCFNFFLFFFQFSSVQSQDSQINYTRQQVIDRLESYINHPHEINNNHTNKWQNNYWTHDGYNHSSWLGYEGTIWGAPYGYGLKDIIDPEPSGTRDDIAYKINQGEFRDLNYEIDTVLTFFPDDDEIGANPYLSEELIITTTRYTEDKNLQLEVSVDDANVGWKVRLYNIQYHVDVENRTSTKIWETENWHYGDDILNTENIEYTGKYVLEMEVGAFESLDADITVWMPEIVDEDYYACGSHKGHYHYTPWSDPDSWAFGIDCSGFACIGYGLESQIGDLNTRSFAGMWDSLGLDNIAKADYIVKAGSHIVIFKEDLGGGFISVLHSTGRFDNVPPPDGTGEEDKDIEDDYLDNGYHIRTPFEPLQDVLPEIQDVYLVNETDPFENKIDFETNGDGNYLIPLDEYSSFDIIVQTVDQVPGIEIMKKTEVKTIKYRYYIKGTTPSDWVNGFTSEDSSDNYNSTGGDDFIYASGTDYNNKDFHYIATNGEYPINDSGTWDISGYGDGDNVKIDVIATDWVEKSDTFSVVYEFEIPEDENNPIIHQIYLTEEIDTLEQEIIIENNIVERDKYDIIVVGNDFDINGNVREVKKVEYRYYIEGGSIPGWTVGFDSTNLDMKYVYGSGTDPSATYWKYIVTNNNQHADTCTLDLTDTALFPIGKKLIIEAKVTDSNSNDTTKSEFYYIESKIKVDDITPQIIDVYFAYDSVDTDDKIELSYYTTADGRKFPKLPYKDLDIIVHVKDQEYDEVGSIVTCEVESIYVHAHVPKSDRSGIEVELGALKLPQENYYTSSNKNHFIYAGSDATPENYHYLVTNTTESDEDFWNPEAIVESSYETGIYIYAIAFDWNGNPSPDFDAGYFVDVEDEKIIPDFYTLSPNYPNPFNPETKIEYQLPTNGNIKLLIYNLIGQKIKTLHNGFKAEGFHDILWDGKDEYGKDVSSGIYLCTLQASNYKDSIKLILMR